ncbi:MAG: CDP-diacylglycerol--serine O-phosphatidyltransferase [Candidatus Deianiraeaceae bacterium]|jgi:CDP-diacylglycerol--serine O-phosphatidyltransferase
MSKSKYISLTKLIPSIITISSLCFGVLALYHSTMMHWGKACFFIISAAIFDTMDGRFARMLNARSNFGANLDSLCDFANYTIFPPLIIYNWSLWNHGIFGWYTVMISSVCGAIRLARFNSEDKHINHPIKKMFFHGIPSPSAGILMLLPLIIQIAFGDIFGPRSIQYPPYHLYEIYISIVAISMTSTMPTLSLKHIRIPQQYSRIALVCVGLVIISFFVFKWIAVVFYSALYIASIPVVLCVYYKMMKNHRNKNG